jgi:uncharacterized protein (DUF1330 family)
MEASKTYLIVNAIPNMLDLDSFQSYLKKIVGIFESFGATNMQRFKTTEQIMGNGNIKAIAVFEFPSAQAIKDMKNSQAFNDLNELRKKAYLKEVDLMICEGM